MRRRLKRRHGVKLRFLLGTIATLTLLRVAFYFAFRHYAPALTTHELLLAFSLGLKFDARLAAILALPLLVLRRGVAMYISVIAALLLALYAADFACYAYIHRRVNAGLLELLRNPLISMHMVWESYHVVLFALAILGVLASIIWAARRTSRESGFSSGVALLLIALIYGQISRYPLRWSNAYFSPNRFAGDLAMNPAQYFFETMREKPPSFDVARLRALYPLLVQYLGIDRPDVQRLNFHRTPPVHPQVAGTPNIVIIQLESFAAFKTGIGASPHFDDLARNGLLFTNHYSPSEKTARAIFPVIFGIPDVSPWQASMHNPLPRLRQIVFHRRQRELVEHRRQARAQHCGTADLPSPPAITGRTTSRRSRMDFALCPARPPASSRTRIIGDQPYGVSSCFWNGYASWPR